MENPHGTHGSTPNFSASLRLGRCPGDVDEVAVETVVDEVTVVFFLVKKKVVFLASKLGDRHSYPLVNSPKKLMGKSPCY
jgi:hypothetical protein